MKDPFSLSFTEYIVGDLHLTGIRQLQPDNPDPLVIKTEICIG